MNSFPQKIFFAVIILLTAIIASIFIYQRKELIMKFLNNKKQIEVQVDEYINAYEKKGQFSGAIFIAKNGNILVNKGYGMANYELDVPNNPQTKFMIGSITKQFTAMAIMQLSQKGLLDVNDPIANYIPDYPNGEKITIHHLLTNSSGIPNYTELPEAEEKQSLYFSLEKLIEVFKNKPLEFTPGEKYNYSNSGYILLTYIIEKVSGKSYEEYLQENILKPLGMENSGYAHHENVLKNRASGYSMKDETFINADYIDPSCASGAGALFSTVEDLYLWDRALYTEKLISKEYLNKIFTSKIKIPKENRHYDAQEDRHYAYGWLMSTLLNHACASHGGVFPGFHSYIERCVDKDLCIIVLSNFDFAPVEKISTDLAAIVFGKPYQLPKDF